MCYYKQLHINQQKVFKLLDEERELAQYNLQNQFYDGFVYGQVPIIVPKADCKWDIGMMEWGFIPSYLPNREAVEKFRRGGYDEKGKYRPPMTTLNAVGEDILQPGKMYRDAALKRRCLFISTGFFEWRHIFPMGKKGQPLKTAVKYPYHIEPVGDDEISLIAGVYQYWTDRDTGETVPTCALLTTAANWKMEQIHNSKKRMPTILTKELAGEWICDGLSEERILQIATYQFPAEKMEAWPIAKDFKAALNPTEEFIYGPELPPLQVA